MKIVLRAKGAGKTSQLIAMSARHGHMIICRDRSRASEIFARAMEMKVDIPFPISFAEILTHNYHAPGLREKGFILDDVDLFLAAVIPGVPVHGFSCTIDDDSLDCGE